MKYRFKNIEKINKTKTWFFEMVNKIDSEYQEQHSEIPWKQIYGLRNRIVHDYEGINLKVIWEVIESDLPALLVDLERL